MAHGQDTLLEGSLHVLPFALHRRLAGGEHWLLKVEKSKTCPFELIEVEIQPNNPNHYFWNVTAYLQASDIHKNGADALDCGMYPVTAANVEEDRK